MVSRYNPLKVGIVGTFVPRRCGIATFSGDLLNSLRSVDDELSVASIAMNDGEKYSYPPEVKFEIEQNVISDYRLAADYLAMSAFDAVSLQHEYGIYGGKAGSFVLSLLQRLRLPVISTLHTVLTEPDRDQRNILVAIGELSDRLVVMSETARETLANVYGVPRRRIAMIPHGVPDVPFLDTSYNKDKYDLVGRKVILSFGLISPGKGLEYAVDAMPAIVAAHPDTVFVIAGQTHPGVRRHHGESYRQSLIDRAAELGVSRNVIFRDQYLDINTLLEMLSIADICVTPYLGREQIVSGVLSYALGAGKAIVSTPYRYAEEMLGDGRGRLVPFRDSEAIAREVIDLLSNDVERQTMRKHAYDFARHMVWSDVGRQYLDLFSQVREERAVQPRVYRARSVSTGRRQPPLPNLQHLRVLSDDTGILQHARFAIPDRDHGYCTDDNARALIVALMARNLRRDDTFLMPLAHCYMSFLQHAFNQDEGRFRNFMSFDRQWQESIGSEDSHGRALWALGRTVLEAPSEGLTGAALSLFERALPAALEFKPPRSWAFALIGIDAYLGRFGGASHARQARKVLAGRLMDMFTANAADEWPWLEDEATYANGAIAQALISSGSGLGDNAMVEMGLRALRWLVDVQTDPKGHFVPVGNDGWLKRGSDPARFDQQPIEAQHMVDALLAALEVTGDSMWLDEARRCYEWFLGRNDLQQEIADISTGGCRDGLRPDGVNSNQGAESTLAWLHTSTRMHLAVGAVEAVSRLREAEEEARSPNKVVPLAGHAVGARLPH